jgi:undecaprenyl diphosphate synthase
MSDSPLLHLAIIPDGNRRWAKTRSLAPWKGHAEAMKRIRELLEWCENDGRIGVLTLWLFSTENWKRPAEEVAMLMKMMEKELQKERKQFQKERIRFRHAGRRDRIPRSLADLIRKVEKETETHERFTFQIALDYGGKDEVLRAVKDAGTTDLDDASIRQHLDQPDLPDIDLIVRTSGEMRTSNFFLWQSAYAEWVFTEKLFPDFQKDDLAAAVTEYERRQRRFGS